MNLEDVKEVLKDEPKFRLKQIYQAIFSNSIKSWDEASNLPKDLRERLKKEADISIDAEIFEAKDKRTVKAVISLAEGRIETVLMRHKSKENVRIKDGDAGHERNTVCVSTQIGCSMGCDFCLTGRAGFTRNLNFNEIVEQVLLFNRYLKDEGQRVTNVVFMGMGEPFLNYDEVIKAVKALNDKETFNIGIRKISISTVGIIEGINKLSRESLQVNLAISLHFPDDELRSKLMGVNNSNPLKALLKAVRNYIDKTGRKVMIEYIMLSRVNDSDSQAKKLADLLNNELGDLFVVNLIAYNETDKYKASPKERISSFKKILEDEGVEVIQRYGFGDDIKAACGQLSSITN